MDTMEEKEKKTTENTIEELEPDKLESVSGGYPVFKDFETTIRTGKGNKEKEK